MENKNLVLIMDLKEQLKKARADKRSKEKEIANLVVQIEEFKDIPNPKISDKYKCILSRVYVSSAENEYAKYDAGSRELTNDYSYQKGCLCGEIISGNKNPTDCPLYNKICTPENPKGACMVSNEGTCHNYITNNRK